jgi:O-antigen ligase
LALALLLPAAVLLWPATLAGSPTPASQAAGLSLVCLLPAALLLLLRGLPKLPIAAWALVFVAGLAGLLGANADDNFEARRASFVLLSAAILLLGGLRLEKAGRNFLRAGVVLASLAATLQCAWTVSPGGPLGNSGDLSEAALPGALVGLAWFAEGRPRGRMLGLAAAICFVLHASWAPVWTGALAFGIVAMLPLGLGMLRPTLGRYGRVGVLLCMLLVLAAAFGPRAGQAQASQAQPVASATTAAANSLTGLEVRRLIWAQAPAMLSANLLLGIGPGQFEREFPPYRDLAEIELSSHNRTEPTPVDVEHLHNDWLQGPVDLGLVGGLAWLAFLLLVGARALRTLMGPGAQRRGAALASLGVLLAAAGNSILLEPIASSALALPLMGVLLASDRPQRLGSPKSRYPLAAILLLAAALHTPAALNMLRHGQALAVLAGARQVETTDGLRIDGLDVLLATNEALSFAPDSVDALASRARLPNRSRAERLGDLERLLELRPHRRAARIDLGVLQAQGGRYEQALEAFDAVLILDSRQPAALANRVSVAARAGLDAELEPALAALDLALIPGALRSRYGVGPEDLLSLGLEVLRRGQFATAERLLLRADQNLKVTDPNVCWARAQAARIKGQADLENALLAGFHLDAARSHRAEDNTRNALRSFRQAGRFSSHTPEVQLEWAEAHVADGNLDEARRLIEELDPQSIAIARPAPGILERLRNADLLKVPGR